MRIENVDVDLNAARVLSSPIGNPTNDDLMYNLAAYHVQQAAEKSLKYMLYRGLGVSETDKSYWIHSISSLMTLIEEKEPGFIAAHQDLSEVAIQLTAWEANARYADSAFVKKEDVEKLLRVVEEFRTELYEKYETALKK